MTMNYTIPANTARTEIRVVNSRFIGSAAYTPTVEDAKAYIAQVRADFPDATHHAYAYIVGYGASVTAGMSDAGEPSGTAGRPMLAVVRGSDIGDITVVVTRFFGGTLLGTGGLVRAYSDATRAVLEVLPLTEHIETHTCTIRVAYALYTPLRNALGSFDITIVDEEFAADVALTITIPQNQYTDCTALITQITAGQASITLHSDEQ